MKNSNTIIYNRIFYFLLCSIGVTYILLEITPSSYGVALANFGLPDTTFLGRPKPIRSDEWSVWTPHLQMAVNNEFQRFYSMPEYNIDLRGFNLLPLEDWMLPFKPFVWGYFIFSPSVAFSIYHFLIFSTFVIGWKQLVEKVIFPLSEHKVIYSSIFSLIFYFSGFSQYWLTTLGPILAISPWLILALISKSKWRFLAVFYIAVAWLVSHTYPPIIVQVAYLGLVFILIYEKNWNKQVVVDYLIKGVVCIISVLIVALYFKDVISIMSQTVYPGKRVSLGGDGFWQLWLSSFFPYWIIDGYSELINLNISEVGTVSSFLPLFVLCFIKLDKKLIKTKIFIAFSLLFVLTTLWFFVAMPEWLAKISLLYMSPAHRGLFLLGTSINLLSLYCLVHGRLIVSLSRITLFSFIVVFSYVLPSFLGYIDFFEKTGFELFCLVLIFIFYFFRSLNKLILIFSTLIVSLLYTFLFNPIQPANPIFDIINSDLTKKFNEEKNEQGWVIKTGYKGSILTGIGVASFTNVLIQPQLDFFRKLYPNLEEKKFNDIFNRYGHINLLDISSPSNPYPDVIALPIKDFIVLKNINLELQKSNEFLFDFDKGGYIDEYYFDDKENSLFLRGWSMSMDIKLVANQDISIKSIKSIERKDVALALNDKDLMFSGFEIQLNGIKDIYNLNLCLISQGEKYSNRILQLSSKQNFYSCDP